MRARINRFALLLLLIFLCPFAAFSQSEELVEETAPEAVTSPSGPYCVIGAHPGLKAADAQTATLLICDELRKQGVPVGVPTYDAPKNATIYRSAFHRLGKKILVRLSEELPADSIVADRQLMVGKIEEITKAAPRLVDALVHRKTIEATASIDSVVAQDAPEMRKKQGDFLWNVGIFGSFVPGTDILAKPGMEMGGFYETEQIAVGTQFRFSGGTMGNDSLVYVSFGIGGRYFFNKSNLSPYVGGGLAWGTLAFSTDSPDGDQFDNEGDTGLGTYAVVGLEFLRLYESRLMLELRVDAPLYRLHDQDSVGKTKYVVPLTLGISYAW